MNTKDLWAPLWAPEESESDGGKISSGLIPLLTAVLQRDQLKGFTLTQPWAAIMGKKQIETRSWSTAYRGPIALHSAKGWSRDDEDLCDQEPFRTALEQLGYIRHLGNKRNPWSLPLGQILAIGMLEEVHHIVGGYQRPTEPERSFGNYGYGRYAWHFSAIYRLTTPIPARGSLGLWNWQPIESFWVEIQEQLDKERAAQCL